MWNRTTQSYGLELDIYSNLHVELLIDSQEPMSIDLYVIWEVKSDWGRSVTGSLAWKDLFPSFLTCLISASCLLFPNLFLP